MASEALIQRAVIARARNYGLDVEDCDVDALRVTVKKLDALPIDAFSSEQVERIVAALNEGATFEDAREYATRRRL